MSFLPRPFLFAAAAVAMAPVAAHALVLVGNPPDVTINMPGADDADVLVDITYQPCQGSPTVETDVSGDMIEGIALNPPAGEICSIVVDLDEDVTINGTNASGEFEILVEADEFDVTINGSPVTLKYTVISGSVSTAPELRID